MRKHVGEGSRSIALPGSYKPLSSLAKLAEVPVSLNDVFIRR